MNSCPGVTLKPERNSRFAHAIGRDGHEDVREHVRIEHGRRVETPSVRWVAERILAPVDPGLRVMDPSILRAALHNHMYPVGNKLTWGGLS